MAAAPDQSIADEPYRQIERVHSNSELIAGFCKLIDRHALNVSMRWIATPVLPPVRYPPASQVAAWC